MALTHLYEESLLHYDRTAVISSVQSDSPRNYRSAWHKTKLSSELKGEQKGWQEEVKSDEWVGLISLLSPLGGVVVHGFKGVIQSVFVVKLEDVGFIHFSLLLVR